MIACLPMLLGACTLAGGAPLPQHRYEFTHPAMGVAVRIVLYTASDVRASRAADAAWARIDQLNALLSDYNHDSELLRLCREAGPEAPVRVSEDLWRVLTAARAVSEATGGAFDVTASPVVMLWRQCRALRRLPERERLDEALAHVGWQMLLLDRRSRSVRLARSDMRLDVGGIAKGYIVREALAAMREQGIGSALVDAGGDLACGDPPPGERGWRIALLGLGDAESAGESLVVSNAGVSTSGDRWQYVEIDGVRYSHIVDPRTGAALTGRRSVTVTGRDPMLTDAWATALNVLGPDEALAALTRAGELAARCIYEGEAGVSRLQNEAWRHVPRAPREDDATR